MNESGTETTSLSEPIPPVAVKRDSKVLGVLGVTFASIAFMTALLHWVVLLYASYGYDDVSKAFGAMALGMVVTFLAQIILIPTVGLTGLILTIIALVRSRRSKVLALIGLILSTLTVISIIIQIFYWAYFASLT